MPPRRIIALVGVDGSGKTTQAALLARWLTAEGVPAWHFENPGGRPTWNRLARRLGRRDGPDLLGRGYVVAESAVRWTMIARALLISRLGRRVAVMDRYSYCQYALMRVRRDPGERIARRVFGLFPTPDLVCLLVLPAIDAQQRVELRGLDHEEAAHLAAFDAAYRSLPEAASFRVVDGSGTHAAVQAALRAVISGVTVE